MNKQLPTVGPNKTGIGVAPERAEEMLEGVAEFPATSTGGDGPAGMRIEYAKEGVRTGSIPEVGIDGSKADPKLALFMDKLGARLAFERNGTRLYEGLISKHDAYGGFQGGPSRKELEEHREEEHEHALLLQRVITELGGDPTAVTPCANLQATAGRGVGDVIADARTTLCESLDAMLIAELADRESWEGLIAMADALEQDGPADEFREALATEEEHLRDVRKWVLAGQEQG